MMQRSLIAIVLSIVSISILLKINNMIAHIYEMSGQKTRSLFGIVELGFLYKYYTGILGLMAIILAITALKKSEEKSWVIAAFTISICAFLATFVKLWKFMV
jgi:hypothetical protein